MTAGRKPKPTNLRLIQGTFRQDRAKPSEAKPQDVIPPCPKFLQGEARKQYQKTAKKFAQIELIRNSTTWRLRCCARDGRKSWIQSSEMSLDSTQKSA